MFFSTVTPLFPNCPVYKEVVYHVTEVRELISSFSYLSPICCVAQVLPPSEVPACHKSDVYSYSVGFPSLGAGGTKVVGGGRYERLNVAEQIIPVRRTDGSWVSANRARARYRPIPIAIMTLDRECWSKFEVMRTRIDSPDGL